MDFISIPDTALASLIQNGQGIAGSLYYANTSQTLWLAATQFGRTIFINLRDLFSGAGQVPNPNFATISASAAGVNVVVPGVGGKRILVLQGIISASDAVTVKFQQQMNNVQSDLDGGASVGKQGGYVLPYSPAGWLQTDIGNDLVLNLSDAVAVGGALVYTLV